MSPIGAFETCRCVLRMSGVGADRKQSLDTQSKHRRYSLSCRSATSRPTRTSCYADAFLTVPRFQTALRRAPCHRSQPRPPRSSCQYWPRDAEWPCHLVFPNASLKYRTMVMVVARKIFFSSKSQSQMIGAGSMNFQIRPLSSKSDREKKAWPFQRP